MIDAAQDVIRITTGWNRLGWPGRYGAIFENYREIWNAPDYSPRWFVIPEPPRQTLQKSQLYEARLSLLPKSFILGISTYSQQSAGFTIQITDLGTRYDFFSNPVFHSAVSEGTTATPEGVQLPVHYLAWPRLVLDPGILSVTLRNLDPTNTNQVQVVLHVAEPPCRYIEGT